MHGFLLRTQDGIHPVFVTVGDRIDLSGAQQIVLACAGAPNRPAAPTNSSLNCAARPVLLRRTPEALAAASSAVVG